MNGLDTRTAVLLLAGAGGAYIAFQRTGIGTTGGERLVPNRAEAGAPHGAPASVLEAGRVSLFLLIVSK
ncbi:hypothetical protein [Streptomyces sp. V4I2]|uniref:hypothetical protein n=1 Tax=Streptomyces sp. V4I2 TaxID=3042280 RepID=UPI00278A71FF|nr:hypothetical protein [Streptomyces sp. V4I2]MDQ1042036.1 hypothetical protein [Streptomyces sp. V4I2]